jgi:hypothetical protein
MLIRRTHKCPSILQAHFLPETVAQLPDSSARGHPAGHRQQF